MVFKALVFDDKANTYNGTLINHDNEEFKIAVRQDTPDSFSFSVKKFVFIRQATDK